MAGFRAHFGYGKYLFGHTSGWLGGKRGAGVRGPGVWKMRGVENTGSGGKRGVWWKTRGLVENAGSGGKRGV